MNKYQTIEQLMGVGKALSMALVTASLNVTDATLQRWIKWGVKLGLSTAPVDPKVARRFVVWLYTDILKKPVPPIVIVGGPRDMHRYAYAVQSGITAVPRRGVTHINGVPDNEAAQKEAFIWPYLDGQFWSNYVAYYRCMQQAGVKLPASFNRLQDIAKLGLIYPLDAVCIMTERMEQCHRDKQGRLHRVKGPAVSYRDGFKVWCLNGERQKAPA